MEKPAVLYIDDEEINLRIFKNTFRREYVIYLANNAHDGLELVRNEKINVILTDQRMPEVTGVDFLKLLIEIFPEAPPWRVIISGYSDKDAIDEAFKHYQLYGFISKPWEPDELRSMINGALNC